MLSNDNSYSGGIPLPAICGLELYVYLILSLHIAIWALAISYLSTLAHEYLSSHVSGSY